ncbi:DUF6801 domain-containing protein [Amycolatopsis sp. CA-230715]|uniref:DUF6801 domain-containing protein n=1 Tax=Amycolatopsis sp. CA-230715 TaxID=2745196 RepID=UPI001C01E65C|nr:DUF6801 domain-containing protein [Amycolatopsis sp. CA-230715]QWF83753.1 hypothetical protein HUW46_07196 [Amycolatopsis sp. CA-230715]
MSSPIRKKALAAAAAVGATGLVAVSLVVGAQTSAASPVSLTLNYHCDYPLVGSQGMKVVINTDLPDSVPVGKPTGVFDIKAVATVNADTVNGLGLIGATTLEGESNASAKVEAPGINLPVTVKMAVPKTNVPASGELPINVQGQTPSLTFQKEGDAKITVGDIALKVTPRKADGSVTEITPDGTINAPCKQDAGQNNVLKTIKIGEGGGTPTDPTTPPTKPTEPTTPPTDPTTPPTNPTTPPNTGGTKIGYNIAGQTALKALGSTAPIKGSFDADADLGKKTFVGDLKLDPSHTDFKLLGFLPGGSDIKVVQNGEQHGELVDKGFVAHVKFDVFLPTINLFGIPISSDPKCQTTAPSTSDLKTAPDFDLLKGGKLSGTYSLAAVKDCGGLNDYINWFVKSDGNTLELNLTRK